MKRMVLAAVVASAIATPAAAETLNVFGTFSLPDGRSRVEIGDCGNGSPCGHIVWLNPSELPVGVAPESVENDKGERILGYRLLHGFAKKVKDWRGGKIKDPEDGKTYDARLKRLGNGDLEVKGCIGPICQTQIWTPVS